jgi:hypothetical protein
MLMILADSLGGMSGAIAHWAIIIILIAAVAGIMFVVLRQMGINIPPFVVMIFWILVAAFVGIVAIKFLLSISW